MCRNYYVKAVYKDGETENWVTAKNDSEARLVWGLTHNEPDRYLVKLIVEKI
jgi:hypothetical protein